MCRGIDGTQAVKKSREAKAAAAEEEAERMRKAKAEVERAKVSLKAAMLSNLDGHNNVAEEIGRSLLNYGRRMTPAETFARIDAITTDDIKATAYKFFNDKDHALAAVGGIHELPDYTWFRRHSYWLRY